MGTRLRTVGFSWCGWGLVLAAFPGPASPQEAPDSFLFSGEVRIGNDLADSGTVVLHRVSAAPPGFSGAVDSVRIEAGGRFRFTVRPVPGSTEDDVYFASIHHQNVLYFGAPVAGSVDVAETYVLQAYRSVDAGPGTRLSVRVRNVFVERAGPGAGWLVTDLFEVENDLGVTLVASEEGATWSHALPPGARGFAVGPSDVAPESASFSGGRVFVSAPILPGEQVFLFRYDLPEDDFTLPMEGATGSMELLFNEPAGEIAVTGLASLGPIDMEGGTFRRFAGRDMAPAVVAIERGPPLSTDHTMRLLAALLALVLTAAGSFLAFRARSREPAAPGDGPTEPRRRLLIAVARLDEARNAGDVGDEEYARQRAGLLKELKG